MSWLDSHQESILSIFNSDTIFCITQYLKRMMTFRFDSSVEYLHLLAKAEWVCEMTTSMVTMSVTLLSRPLVSPTVMVAATVCSHTVTKLYGG